MKRLHLAAFSFMKELKISVFSLIHNYMGNLVRNRLSKKMTSLSFDKDSLRKLLDVLQKRADSACDIEYKNIESQIPPENLDKAKENLESCRLLKITIVGDQNDELFGTIEEVFNSVSFPDSVQTFIVLPLFETKRPLS